MSIVRIGFGETKIFAEGYDAIFGKKGAAEDKSAKKPAEAESSEKKDEKKNERKK